MSKADGTSGFGGREETNDELSVTTVLTREPDMMREMLIAQMEHAATHIAGEIRETTSFYRGRPRKTEVDRLRRYVAEINECVDLLGQVGWRKVTRRTGC